MSASLRRRSARLRRACSLLFPRRAVPFLRWLVPFSPAAPSRSAAGRAAGSRAGRWGRGAVGGFARGRLTPPPVCPAARAAPFPPPAPLPFRRPPRRRPRDARSRARRDGSSVLSWLFPFSAPFPPQAVTPLPPPPLSPSPGGGGGNEHLRPLGGFVSVLGCLCVRRAAWLFPFRWGVPFFLGVSFPAARRCRPRPRAVAARWDGAPRPAAGGSVPCFSFLSAF